MNQFEGWVGVSVSDPGEQELRARGLTDDHVRHAFVEIARQVLAAGGSLAYGGDLRQGGYTEVLIALLRTYSRADRPAKERVHQYLARPVWQELSPAHDAELSVLATPIKVTGVNNGERGDRVSRAQDFTAMREQMTSQTDARIVIGGRLAGQQGRWPGVVEEAYLALRARQPLFVAGGLGGAASRLASALRGDWPIELTVDYQRAHTDGYDELVAANAGVPDDELRGALEGADLSNGLDEDENALLLQTVDLDLVVALILRGLSTRRSS
jgi:hypothetical protein